MNGVGFDRGLDMFSIAALLLVGLLTGTTSAETPERRKLDPPRPIRVLRPDRLMFPGYTTYQNTRVAYNNVEATFQGEPVSEGLILLTVKEDENRLDIDMCP